MSESKDLFRFRFDDLLHKSGWTKDQFAVLAGINISLINKWLRGAALPSYENLLAVADTFGLSLSEFFNNSSAPFPRIDRPTISDELRDQTAKIAEQAAVSAAAAAITEFQQKIADPLMVRLSQFIAQKPENRQHLENFLESMAVSTEGLLEQDKDVTSSKKPKAQ